jgi:hypothetical protein
MKRLIFVCLVFFVAGFSNSILAQQPGRNTDTSFSKAYVDSLEKAQADSIKIYADSLTEAKLNAASNTADGKGLDLGPNGNITVVILFFIVMVLLLILFFTHIRFLPQRIGFQSIKLIGLILIFPGICILTIVGGTAVLSGQTLAALLGTIAGYVLSRDDDSKDIPKDAAAMKQETQRKEAELKQQVAELEEKIKIIRDNNPGLKEG